jgi:hypothetical protein
MALFAAFFLLFQAGPLGAGGLAAPALSPSGAGGARAGEAFFEGLGGRAAPFRAAPAGAMDGGGLLDGMGDGEWRLLNVFFSNFYEAAFDDFSALGYDARKLIHFGVRHNMLNNPRLFIRGAGGFPCIDAERAHASIEKYFGVGGVRPQSVDDYLVYRGGKYCWEDAMDGALWFGGSQAVALFDNFDGTLSAIVEDYNDNYEFQAASEAAREDFIKTFYAPRRSWPRRISRLCEAAGYHAALIAPHFHGGKSTYRLLEWRGAGSFHEARRIIESGFSLRGRR